MVGTRTVNRMMARTPPEVEKLNPAAGPPKEDAWAVWRHEHPPALDKDSEYEAVEELNALRQQALEKDAITLPKLSREPARRDPRAGFWSQSQPGRS
jgi:hypothetical protein